LFPQNVRTSNINANTARKLLEPANIPSAEEDDENNKNKESELVAV